MKTRILLGGYGTELTGKTIDSIIRREYGRKATWRPARDHNSPFYGQVIKTNKFGVHILTNIVYVYGDNGERIYGPSISPRSWVQS